MESEATKKLNQDLLNEFLSKLDKINFTEYNEYQLISNNWRVEFTFKFDSNIANPLTPVWVVINAYYDGTLAANFSCTNEDAINTARVWFIRTSGFIDEQEALQEDEYQILAKNAFKNL